jgi:putative NADH-flavin reductase
MQLLLIGATGRTGRLVLEQAIARGHTVTAVGRSVAALPTGQGVRAVVADPLQAQALAPILPGHDAVLSILGGPGGVLRDGAAALLEALRGSQVRRYIAVSQGLHFPSSSPLVWVLRRVFASALEDSGAMERMVAASDLEWTIVRPPRLRVGGRPRGYRVEVGRLPQGALSMERADLATYLLDEAQSGAHPNTIVGVTSG